VFIPELAARNQGVGGEQAHAVNLGRGVTLSDLVTANDEVLVELWVVQNVHLANCARRCECVPAWLPPTPFRHSLPPSPALLSVSRLSLQRTVRSVIRKKKTRTNHEQSGSLANPSQSCIHRLIESSAIHAPTTPSSCYATFRPAAPTASCPNPLPSPPMPDSSTFPEDIFGA